MHKLLEDPMAFRIVVRGGFILVLLLFAFIGRAWRNDRHEMDENLHSGGGRCAKSW